MAFDNIISSQNSNLAKKDWRVTSTKTTGNFQSVVGGYYGKTLTWNDLPITPTEAVYVPTWNKWITQSAEQGCQISGNSISVPLQCFGYLATQFAEAGGYVLYR